MKHRLNSLGLSAVRMRSIRVGAYLRRTELFDRARWYRFIYTRLWLWTPVLLFPVFGLFTALAVWCGSAGVDAVTKGLISTGLLLFCWMLGVWSAVGPDEDPDEVSEERAEDEGFFMRWLERRSKWFARVFTVLILAGLLFLIFGDLITGDKSWPETITGIVMQLMVIVCVVLPGVLQRFVR